MGLQPPRRHPPSLNAAVAPAPPRDEPSPSLLLIIDMIGTWDFVDADKLLRHANAIAPRIARLKARCQRAGWAIVYVNDNHGRWRSDFRQLVESAQASSSAGSLIAHTLMPAADDYFILKPKHSPSFARHCNCCCNSCSARALQQLQCARLVLSGVASDQCISATAADALMREFQVDVPRDCIATQTKARQARALRHFDEVLRIGTAASPRMRLAQR